MLCLVLWVFGSGELWKCSFCVGHLLALQALFLLRLRLPFRGNFFGSFSSWVFFFFFFPPLGGQGKRGGSRGAPSVFLRCFLPSRSTLVRREGQECLWAFVCRVRARSFFSSSFGRWGRGSWLSCCRRPFPASPSLLTLPNSHRTFHDVRIRGSLQSLAPAFYPPASHALQSVARGWIRGLGHVRLALVDVAVALALAPLTVRG